MPVTAPPRGVAGALASRQARPLTGIEVRDAVEKHTLTLIDKLLSNAGLLSDQIISMVEKTRPIISEELLRHSRLQRINITYPKVGWSIKVRLEELEIDPNWKFITGEIELDLERSLRLNIRFGGGDVPSKVISSLEEEKIPSGIPDKTRQEFGLPVTTEVLKPDGSTEKVSLEELKGERRAARTVDVGSGAIDRMPVQVPADEIKEDGSIVITSKEILAAGGEQGEVIVTPKELPPITLEEDLIATPPPPPPKEPLKEPLAPPNSMNKIKRPDVKFKK